MIEIDLLAQSMATVAETLALLGSSLAPIHEQIPDSSDTESRTRALEQMLETLGDKFRVLLNHKTNVSEALGMFGNRMQQIRRELAQHKRIAILPTAVIHFVDLLDKAIHYFEFKKIAKQTYDFTHAGCADDICRTLLDDPQLKPKFRKIGETGVLQAAQSIYCQLHQHQLGKEIMEDEDVPIRFDWIYKLAFQTLEMGYVLNEDPIVELEKMLKSKPYQYDNYFLDQQLPVKCTKSSAQEARDKYSKLVSRMLAKYEETITEKHKFTFTGTSSRNTENERQRFTPTLMKQPFVMTCASEKAARHEKRRALTKRNYQVYTASEGVLQRHNWVGKA